MISLLKRIQYRLKTYYSRIAERIYLKQQMKKNRGKCTVVLPEIGIGDVCIAMAYLKAFRKAINKPIILYLHDGNNSKTIVKFYEGYDEIKFVKQRKLMRISCAAHFHNSWKWYEKYHKKNLLVLVSPSNYIPNGLLSYTKLNCLCILRDTAYRLGENAEMSVPSLSIDEPNNENKRILFNLFSNSMDIPIETFFPAMEYFAAAGYEVYTNCKDEQSYCLPGTKPYVATITELYKTARRFEYIVSIRSGILDFLAATGVKQIVFYNGISYVNLYSMKMWGCVDALELMWDDENAMQKIKAYVEGGNES